MTILVTGGAGYIGSQVVRHLCDAGERPVVLDNLSTGSRRQLPHGVPLIEADAGDGRALQAALAAHGVRDVMHFAGSISVEESVRDPALYYRNNTGATATLIEACERAEVRNFIFSSTAAVYGAAAGKTPESAAIAPVSPYGHSKWLAEEIIRAAAPASGLRYGILRYFNVAGADPQGRGGQINPHSRHLVSNALRAARGELPAFEVFGADYDTPDGSGVRDFIHVADLADVHLRMLAHLRGGGESGVFNCGYGEGFSVLQAIDVVKRVTGIDFPVRHAPRRAGDAAYIVADTRLAQSILGWTPRFNDLDVIIAHAWAWETAPQRHAMTPG
ncbi:MAG: UDP-glucose 4-epimerase GalE [Hyphomonadaceae bacterium]